MESLFTTAPIMKKCKAALQFHKEKCANLVPLPLFCRYRIKMVVITNEMKRAHAIIKAMAGCHPKEILEEQQKAIGDDALKRTAMYEIVKRVKEDGNLEDNRGKFDHKFVRTPEMIAEVTLPLRLTGASN